MIEIKKLNPNAIIPAYSTERSAGMDLYACIDPGIQIPPMRVAMIPTGISLNMETLPASLMSIILPRSGKGAKEGKVLGNLVGVIDQDYHGELLVCLWNRNEDVYITIEPNERFAQLIFVPIIRPEFKLVEEFSTTTARGAGGFGSTDAK